MGNANVVFTETGLCARLLEMAMKRRRFLSTVVVVSLCGLTAGAQIAADIRGRVVDSSGATVANAQIDLTQVGTDTHVFTISSGSGDYSFTSLTPGVYQLDLTATGFAHLTRAGIQAIVGQTVEVDLSLRPRTNEYPSLAKTRSGFVWR